MTATLARPHLTERQKELLSSQGLRYEVGDLSIIVTTPDECIVRLGQPDVDSWLSGYLLGKGAK